MTPAARVATAAGILDDILAGSRAEAALSRWARASRYAGSKDRAAVRDLVFAAVRCRRSYACLGGVETGRGLMIGHLRANGVELSEMLTGGAYGLSAPEAGEGQGDLSAAAMAVQCDMPDWLMPVFEADLGAQVEPVMQALQRRAPVFLRVNLARTTRSEALGLLARDEVGADAHPDVATAVVVTKNERRVKLSAAYTEGLVELQDAASQAAVLELPLSDGMRVLDYCAGGGGKALAMAGRAKLGLWVHDAAPERMADLPVRAQRAGVTMTMCETADLAQQAPFDLVLVDAPCSGSGTWRRDPEGKWALTPERLEALTKTQAEILDQAATLVASGGALAYMTCSVMDAENGGQSAAFARRNAGWTQDVQRSWLPSGQGDGFYLSVLRRESQNTT